MDKRIFIFLIFLVGILLISPISAQGIDDNASLEDASSVNDEVLLSEDLQTLDENVQDSLKSEVKNGDLLGDDSQNDIKGSFRDLQKQIDDADEVLNLSYDFAYSESIDGDDFTDGIYVYDKSITINGNGHKISGENSARIFWFDLYDGEATLNNLTLIGGSYDEGGAIYVDRDSTVYISNVNFSANTAKLGGALYSEGKVYITDSVFDSNNINLPVSAELDGGAAIFNYGEYLSICNSNITNNLKDVVDESNYLAGAVATYSNTHIEDCYFADNGGSLGGAVSSWGSLNYGDSLLSIINTVFKGNVAKFGGAVYALSFNLEIDNCTFEDNMANGSDEYYLGGGAILVSPGDFDVEITDTVFTKNSAQDKGGAIVVNAIGEATIDNCTFKSNSAGEGGAVYIKSSDLITISNSLFEANIASNGSAILNDGELVLSNNTINKADAEIYNGQGLIDSALKIIIFANQTISAQIGDVLTLNATFMDDNGNLIYDPYFRFSVNGEDLEEIDCADGLYLCSYEVDSAGEKIISTTYDFGEIDLLISIIKVPKLHVKSEDLVIPEFTINPRPVFSINLSKYATGTFRIIIDEDEYSEVLTNGSASITSSKLSLGKHNVTVIYSDDDNYVPYFNNTNLTILIESRLDNVVIPKLTNNPEPVFSITMPDEATGTLIVDVNGNEYSAPLVNGSAEVKVPKLDDGEYNITVTYTGDGKYSSVTKSSVMTVFNLKPYPEFSQSRDAQIVYSNDYVYKVLLTFNRKPAAGQTVDIIFNGITYKCVTDNSGYASLKINTKLTANEYAITARYGNIEVSNKIKINHLIKVSVKMTKSKTLKVVVTLNKVNGKVLKSKKVRLVLKGKKYTSKTNKKGVATFKISKKALSKFKKGKTYNCQVSYDGDKIIKKFKIKKWRLINL